MVTRERTSSSFFLELSGFSCSGGKKKGNFFLIAFSEGLYTGERIERRGLGRRKEEGLAYLAK
jgi:hypothetical protein